MLRIFMNSATGVTTAGSAVTSSGCSFVVVVGMAVAEWLTFEPSFAADPTASTVYSPSFSITLVKHTEFEEDNVS